MLTYPTHFYDPVIPKLGLSARRHYRLSKVDTGGFLLLQNFCVAISVSPHVCFIVVLILISMFLR